MAESPTKESTTKESPAKESPTKESPTKESPTKESPTKESPTKESPTKESPTKESPTKESPTKESPTKESPTKESPTKESPTKESPTKESPTKESPTNESPTKKSPAASPPKQGSTTSQKNGTSSENPQQRNLVQWLKGSALVAQAIQAERKARELFEDCVDKNDADVLKYTRMVDTMTKEQDKNVEEFTRILADQAPVVARALSTSESKLKEAMKKD